jgi:serine/threonine-protein kinase
MGAVYKARQLELDRLVALKILPSHGASDPAFAERFAREARALARLNHPNIVAVYDFGRTADGLYYFLMEYVDGVNLRQAMHAGQMNPQEALAIVPQICDALELAHEEGVVHRDIKPENILIDKRGRVKIADFGLAKLMAHGEQASLDSPASLTGTQQVMGTVRYMAPEQMEGTKAVDHRADIYSLGVVFYELLTGELPVGRFAPPSKKVHIDVRLDEVVLRALEKEPEHRYQHATDVKSAIEQVSIAEYVPRPQPPSTTSNPSAELFPRLTVTLVSGGLGCLTLAAGVVLATIAALRESPASGGFWGWMGGALGCLLGGGGALIAAIHSYRHLAVRSQESGARGQEGST